MGWNKAPMNGCPCYECNERKTGCHAKCEKYKAWRNVMDKRKEDEHRRQESKGTLSEHALRQMWRKMRWSYTQTHRRSGQDR